MTDPAGLADGLPDIRQQAGLAVNQIRRYITNRHNFAWSSEDDAEFYRAVEGALLAALDAARPPQEKDDARERSTMAPSVDGAESIRNLRSGDAADRARVGAVSELGDAARRAPSPTDYEALIACTCNLERHKAEKVLPQSFYQHANWCRSQTPEALAIAELWEALAAGRSPSATEPIATVKVALDLLIREVKAAWNATGDESADEMRLERWMDLAGTARGMLDVFTGDVRTLEEIDRAGRSPEGAKEPQ